MTDFINFLVNNSFPLSFILCVSYCTTILWITIFHQHFELQMNIPVKNETAHCLLLYLDQEELRKLVTLRERDNSATNFNIKSISEDKSDLLSLRSKDLKDCEEQNTTEEQMI